MLPQNGGDELHWGDEICHLSSLPLPYLLSRNALDSVGDKEPLLLNILTSVLCQFEACAII